LMHWLLSGSLLTGFGGLFDLAFLLSGFFFKHFLFVGLEKKVQSHRANDQDKDHHRGDEVNFGSSGSGHKSSVESDVCRFKSGFDYAGLKSNGRPYR